MIISICRKSFLLLVVVLLCFLLVGCGNSRSSNNNFYVDVFGFGIEGNMKVELERVPLKVDDLDDIVDLFQEVGNNVVYRDSLLIAKKSSQGMGVNAFAQENLDTLEERGLELSNINKTQIGLKKNKMSLNAVLIEYEIENGFIEQVPILYFSQLFIPNDNDIVLVSFITEDKSSRSSASNLFKSIK